MNLLKNFSARSCRLTALAAGLFLAMTTSWQALAQVSVVSVQPDYGAIDVPPTASVVFTFSVPVDDTSLYITPPGGLGGFFVGSLVFSSNVEYNKFSPVWSGDFTVLTLNYTGDLPGTTTVTWTINPANATVPLRTEEVDFVPLTTGTFTTGAGGCDPDGIPDDYGSIVLFKSVAYLQTSAAPPALKTDELPAVFVSVNSPVDNDVTTATLTYPGTGSPLQLTSVFGTFFHSEEFNTQGLLDAAYPNGSYALILERVSGVPTQLSMPMPAVGSYPPIPQVANFVAAQTINPALAFPLNFNGIPNAGGNDYISLTIMDDQDNTVLSAPSLCPPVLVLPNTATSFSIPANTLAAGKTYTGRLTYGRSFFSSTSNPANFSSNGGLLRQTVFALATTGGVVVPPPQLSITGFQSGFFGFSVTGLQPGTNYRIQYSTTLLPNSWQLVQTLNSSTPLPIFDLTSTSASGGRYYRIVTP